MGFLKYLLFTIITVVLVAFCVVNRDSILIDFFPFPYSAEVPIFIFALSCVVSGVIISGIIINTKSFATNSMIKKMRRRINALENETKILRSENEFSAPTTTSLQINSK